MNDLFFQRSSKCFATHCNTSDHKMGKVPCMNALRSPWRHENQQSSVSTIPRRVQLQLSCSFLPVMRCCRLLHCIPVQPHVNKYHAVFEWFQSESDTKSALCNVCEDDDDVRKSGRILRKRIIKQFCAVFERWRVGCVIFQRNRGKQHYQFGLADLMGIVIKISQEI